MTLTRIYITLLIALCYSYSGYCQEDSSSQVDEAVKAETASLKALRQAVLANPTNIQAYEKYFVFITRMNNYQQKNYANTVSTLYTELMEKHPNLYFIPYHFGKYFYSNQDPRASAYLLMATTLKPDLADAWSMLYLDAMRWGDKELERTYIKNAANADRNSAKYALAHALSTINSDTFNSDSLMLDVDLRFPDTEQGVKHCTTWRGWRRTQQFRKRTLSNC